MKYIITESQYNLIKEDVILQLPGVEYFGGYEGMLKYLERKGNPLFSIEGDSDLRGTKIESLGNLTSVGGYLNLRGTPLSKKYSVAQIRQIVNVGEGIYV